MTKKNIGIDTTDPKIHDEPGSWGRLSEGWPETAEHALSKFTLCGRGKVIPYGCYVLVGSYTPHPVLRVASRAMLDELNDAYDVIRRSILEDK